MKIFRSDNGGEFINEAFTRELESAGVQRQCSAPYAHQQNGKAERVMRTIEGRMYVMLDFARLPGSLWGEAALTACYLFNWTESHALPPGKTPCEMVHGVQPNLSHIRIFGARCFARIPTELQQKLGHRSREGIFMGYPPGVKAWRYRDVATGAFFNSHDIIFDESLVNRPFTDSDDEDEDVPASPPITHPTSPPSVTWPTSPPHTSPSHATILRRSGRIPLPTEKGQHFRNRIEADKSRLARQREVRTARINGVSPPPSNVDPGPVAIVSTPTHIADPPPLLPVEY